MTLLLSMLGGDGGGVVHPFGTACKVCSTTAKILASDFENGDTIDGVLLVTGDRVMIAGQADAKENGIYKVNINLSPGSSAINNATCSLA